MKSRDNFAVTFCKELRREKLVCGCNSADSIPWLRFNIKIAKSLFLCVRAWAHWVEEVFRPNEVPGLVSSALALFRRGWQNCILERRERGSERANFGGVEVKDTAFYGEVDIFHVGIRHADHVATLYPQKLALTSPTSGGRSVGIVHSQTQATEFSLVDIFHLGEFPRGSSSSFWQGCVLSKAKVWQVLEVKRYKVVRVKIIGNIRRPVTIAWKTGMRRQYWVRHA
jgi:hypothetical protein